MFEKYGFAADEWPGNSVALIGPIEGKHPSHPRWAIEHHGARIHFDDQALAELFDLLKVFYIKQDYDAE